MQVSGPQPCESVSKEQGLVSLATIPGNSSAGNPAVTLGGMLS